MSDSILFHFLRQLRQQGFPLGAADYLLLLEAVRSGLGLENLEQFKRLLKLLWSKSLEEQQMLDREFDKWVKPHLQTSAAKSPQEKLEEIEDFKLFFRLRLTKSLQELAKSLEEKDLKDIFEEVEKAFAELVEPQLQAIALPKQSEPPPPVTPPPSDEPKLPKPSPQTSVTPPIKRQKQQLTAEQKKVELHYGIVKQSSLPEKPEVMEDEDSHHFQFIPRLPMSQREMAEIWRQLRRPQRVGRLEELDVEGTIDSICRTGFLLRPVLQSRRCNQAQLVVLVDRQGSMAPFSWVVEGICESILRGGLRGRASFYYFHDCPDTYLYETPQLTGAIPLQKVLFEQMQGKSVLIISDAGAAHGFYDKKRREATKTFLNALRSYTYLYAWLNPLPKSHWTVTTAADIKKFVPMFPFNRDGLHDTVNILRGYPFPPGVRLDG